MEGLSRLFRRIVRMPTPVRDPSSGPDNGLFQMYMELIKQDPESNLVVSLYSAGALLSIVAAGSTGKTKDELEKLLGLFPEQATNVHKQLQEGMKHSLVEIWMSNMLYHRPNYPLKPGFVPAMSRDFGLESRELDFNRSEEACGVINSYVSAFTRGKITSIVSPDMFTKDTAMVLLNVIYFHGLWLKPFDRDCTQKKPFKLLSGGTVNVDMMYVAKEFKFKHEPLLDATVLELPYRGEAYSMILCLPRSRGREAFESMEDSLSRFDLGMVELPKQDSVDLYLPKFSLEATLDLKECLQSLGLHSLFRMGEAQLSKMSQSELLFVTDIMQKVVVEVNEEGTEAAAATAMVFADCASFSPSLVFDRPFHAAIRDNVNNVVLFNARVVNPALQRSQ